MEKYYTLDEVATLLQVSKMTLYRYIKAKKLPAIKLWKEYRVTESDLKAFLDTNKTTHE